MYELRHLRAFVAVVEELHFGRAAARLQVSQPTVSVAIRDLERLLGVELLRRSTREVSVTAEGEALLAEARSILTAVSRLSRKASELGERSDGVFVVGLHDEGAAELTMHAKALRFEDVVDQPLLMVEDQHPATDDFFDRFWFADEAIPAEGASRLQRTFLAVAREAARTLASQLVPSAVPDMGPERAATTR